MLTMDQRLLSICIPTRGRVEVIRNTLNSIYKSDAKLSEYEVVIYDSSENDELSTLLRLEYNFPNLVYKKGENRGFLNIISALELGKGMLLKLQNDYSEFKNGSLIKLLEIIRNYKKTKPLLFFGNLSLKNIQVKEYKSFDEFIYELSYYSTWSTSFSIWNSDFHYCTDINVNTMFPHTSLLFEQNQKDLYVINNEELFSNQNISKKGGYNLFNTFAVVYLKMLEDIYNENLISIKTFNHIKSDLYYNFLIDWYYKTKIQKNEYTFDLLEIKKSMNVYYSSMAYTKMIVLAYMQAFKNSLSQHIKAIFNIIKNKDVKINE